MPKNKIKFSYDFPVILTFILLNAILFSLDYLLLKGKILSFLVCPAKVACTAPYGDFPAFNFKNVIHYLRIFLHILSNPTIELFFINSLTILSLGPALEERYGSVILIVMLLLSAMVSGILTACVSITPLAGNTEIVFMLIILSIITKLNARQTLPLNYIFIFIIYLIYCFYKEKTSVSVGAQPFYLPILIQLAGGITGSLFGILPTVKKVKNKTKSKKVKATVSSSDETVVAD